MFDWWVGGFFGKCEIEKDGIYFVVCALEAVVSDKDRYRDR